MLKIPERRRVSTWQWVTGVLLYSITTLSLSANPTTSFKALDFFEGPRDRPQNPTFQRIIDSDQTRYLWCRIHLDNLKHNQGSNPVEFRVRYYRMDGNEFLGEASVSYTLPSTWESAYLYGGWGYDNPGSWEPGIYRIEVYAFDANEDYHDFREGYKLFRTQFVRLTPNPASASLVPDPAFSIFAIEFFEGGRTFPEERKIEESFPVSKTRTIYTQARLINHRYGESDQSATLQFQYLRPDGSELANPDVDMNAKKDWRTIRTSTGWGWKDDDPGNWTPATYRVLVSSGGLLLGESSFEIVEDRPLSLNYSILEMGVFVASGKLPLNPQYQTAFTEGEFAELYANIKVENPNHEVRKHQAEFRLRLLRYRGFEEQLLNEEAVGGIFNPLESDKTFTTRLIPGKNGTWDRGRYGVEIYLGDQLLGIRYFRIQDEATTSALVAPPQPEKPDLPVGYKSLKLFVGGADFEVPEESDYATEFSQKDTRYLWADLFLTKLKTDSETLLLPVSLKFIQPDGSLFQEVNKNFSIKSDMDSPIVTAAHGFEEPGQWPSGNWRVEAWVEGFKIGEQNFTISSDSP